MKIFACLLLTLPSILAEVDEDVFSATRSEKSILGKYKNGAVSSDNVICSKIGRNVLKKGGNAVDAAVATMVCVGAVNSQSSGLGGGHFMTIYNSIENKCTAIDARDRAPSKASKNMFKNDPEGSVVGWKAMGVPGELHGLWTAFKKKGSGKVSWKSLFQPTIDLMKNGYTVSTHMGNAIRLNIKYPDVKRTFWNPRAKRAYQTGDTLKRPDLAKTLRLIAKAPNPVTLFYRGKIANKLMKDIKRNRGLITHDDLKKYKAILRPIIESDVADNLCVCGPPPPSGAAVTQSIIKVMAEYRKSKAGSPMNEEDYHRLIEAMKFAYARRNSLGDMTFVKSAMNLANNITSDSYAKWVRSMITEKTHANVSYYGLRAAPTEDHGTTHISVMDKEGNAVSVTATINHYFGCKQISKKTGIIFNNNMDDFSTPGRANKFGLPPSPQNFIQPDKRPMSSMSPLIFYNTKTKKAEIVVGAAGGSRIISAVAATSVRILWDGGDVKQAVDAPRFHNQLTPDKAEHGGPADSKFPQEIINSLKKRGHDTKEQNSGGSVICAIQKKNGIFYAASDYRKGPESECAGY